MNRNFTLFHFFAITLVMLNGHAGLAGTATVTTGFGVGADAYVQGSSPTTSFGTSGIITTRSNAGNPANNYKAYLRFDLSALSIDLAQATDATLSFSSITARTGVGFSLFALPDGLPGDLLTGWDESTINYNTAPATPANTADLSFISSPSTDEFGNYAVALGSMSGVTTGNGAVHSFSSPQLLDLLRNDTNHLVSIALRRTDTQGVLHLASDENTLGYLQPTLAITAPTFVAVPEPGSAAMGLALLATALRRRRREIRPT